MDTILGTNIALVLANSRDRHIVESILISILISGIMAYKIRKHIISSSYIINKYK